MRSPQERVQALAELAVGIGANVQEGQIVSISAEPGQEPISRAVAEAAYRRGAKFVDVVYFDPHVKHARLKYAARETLDYVPHFIGDRILALGELGAARISFQGPFEPHLFDDIDPDRLGLDMLPRTKESIEVVREQQTNWCILPFPNRDWAKLVHPEMEPEAAYERLWQEIERIMRLDEGDPVAAWEARLAQLGGIADRLNELRLNHLRYRGPGTDLTVGLFPGSRWISGSMENIRGIPFTANLPTEETFTAPDPTRVGGCRAAPSTRSPTR